LACTLLEQPDILLLDEPTNHLDADAVEWLQSYLLGYRGAVLLVTHDRYLLEAVADRIVEIDGGQSTSYDGSYGDYLVARAERRARLSQQRDRRLRLIATEAAWAARSPSARTTKQKGRLKRLEALRESVPEIEDRSYQFRFASGIHKGSTLLQIRGLSKSFGDTVLLQDVDLEVRPGERIGIVGPNGVGKSTLLKLIQGSLPPDRGQIDRTSRATIGLLDQHRSGLDPTDSVIDAAASGNRHVRMGDADVSVQSFLGYFAFPREAFDQQVSALSGGERARLLLARLMIQGHPILLLDEPTNDLDLLTLRVLEESLLDFDGCALIVTHDRAFLDRVCTGILAFEGSGQVVRYASRHQAEAGRPRATPPTKPPKPAPTRAAPRKLSWRERNELDALPGQIEALEQEQARIEAELSRTETYQGDPERLRTLQRRLEALPREIEPLYERWAVLESMT